MLPRPLLGVLAQLSGRLAARTLHRRDAIVRANFSAVFPAISPEEMDVLARRAFIEYARYWLFAAKMSGPLVRDRTKWVSILNREAYLDALTHGGVIFAVPHVGLWDAGGLVSVIEGFPITTVAEEAESPALTKWFSRHRRRLGLDSLPPGTDTTTRLVNLLRDGGAVALVADRDVVGDGIPVPFFGRVAKVPAGPVVLALRANATILPSAVFLRPRGRVEVAIGDPLEMVREGRLRDDVERLTIALVARYEALIRSAPEQWHVFQPIWPDDDPQPAPGALRPSALAPPESGEG